MTSTIRRLISFGIAYLVFALLLLGPGTAWADGVDGDDPTSGPDSTEPVVEEKLDVPVSEQVAGNDGEDANFNVTLGAKKGGSSGEGTEPPAVEDGVYLISSAKEPSRVLDVEGASTKDGANVLLWDYNGNENQQWDVRREESGNYTIVSVNSGMALAYKSASSGANVFQAQLSDVVRGIWSIVSTADGCIVSPAGSDGAVLDICGGGANNGDNVELWESNGGSWQRYWFTALDPQIAATKTLDDGVYTIAIAGSEKQMVDVEGASRSDEANVLLYHGNGGLNQKWYVSRDADNFYTITSVNSGKSLDIYGGGRVPGSNVIQYATHGGANQKWQIRDNGDGTYTVVSKLNGLMLRAASSGDCANISVFADDGSALERFVFAASGLLSDGVYSISSLQNQKEVVDVPGVSKDAGTQLALWSYNAGMNQKFQVASKGGDTYTIQVGHSGQYLQDSDGEVVQAKESGKASQLWKATWDGGVGIMLTNAATGLALTVSGSAKDGAPLVTAEANGGSAQRFMFTTRGLVEPGLYTMRSGTGSRVLDVNGASTADNANVQIWTSNDGNNQKFTISSVGDGRYKIINLNSTKAVAAAGSAAGSNVRQVSYSGSDDQLWTAEIAPGGGAVVFRNAQSGLVLSVDGNVNADGTNVQLEEKTGAKGQTWNLAIAKLSDSVLTRAYREVNAYGSNTSYFMAVDLANHRAVGFKKIGGSWIHALNTTISSGAAETPTVKGDFKIGAKGYSFGTGSTCYYWSQFDKGRKFHSIVYKRNSFVVADGRLGYFISNGCVRLELNAAKWIYDNVPTGSRVLVY